MSKHIYSASVECVNIRPNPNGGFTDTEYNIHTCPETSPYVDLSGTAKCVSAEECRAYGYTLDVAPFHECMSLAKCKVRGYFVHKATRRCIALEDCLALEPRHYAYRRNHLCVSMEPEESCS